jgi:perosamine synthetase
VITTGEGGAITTGSAELAARARRLREHGIERAPERFEGIGLPPALASEERGAWVYEMLELAPNYRLPEPAAALGLSQLRKLGLFLERRRKIADAYAAAFDDLDAVDLPREARGARSAWHLYPVRIDTDAVRGGRAAVYEALRARHLGVQVHYVPVHLQPWYRRHYGTTFGDHPVAERAYLRLLSLPLFPAMTDGEVSRVIDAVREELRRLRR